MKTKMMAIAFCAPILFACNSANSESKETENNTNVAPPATNYDPMKAVDTTKAIPYDSTKTGANVNATVNILEDAKGNTITATYLSQGEMRVLKLQKTGEKEITLMQTEASAKTASYTDGKIVWDARGDDATLTENGKATKFKVKK